MKFRHWAAAWLVVVAVAVPLRAEVRLLTPGSAEPRVRVKATGLGVWSPVAAADERVLNPGGDLLGDGEPAWVVAGDRVFAAWARPQQEVLVVAASSQERWLDPVVVSAPGIRGVPTLIPTPRGEALVVWSGLSEAGSRVGTVRAAVVGDAVQVGATDPVIGGWTVTVAHVGSGLHALTWEPGSRLLADVVWVITPNPPIEPPLLQGRFELSPVGDVGGVQVERLPGSADGPRGDRDSDSVVLTWWTAPRELSFVELAEEGPVLPVETLTSDNGPEHPHRLVREAVRTVSDRH